MKTNCTLILKTEKRLLSFLNFFGGVQSFLWGHWYLCFGLLVTSALGFKAKGGSRCLCALSLEHNEILRFTSGATPADLLVASMAAESFSPTYFQTSISGARDHDLEKKTYMYGNGRRFVPKRYGEVDHRLSLRRNRQTRKRHVFFLEQNTKEAKIEIGCLLNVQW